MTLNSFLGTKLGTTSFSGSLCRSLLNDNGHPGNEVELRILGHLFYAQIRAKIRSKLHARENARARLHPNKEFFQLKEKIPALNQSYALRWLFFVRRERVEILSCGKRNFGHNFHGMSTSSTERFPG